MSNTEKRVNQDKFNFFVPFELEKGKDKTGKPLMKIKGICSSISEDSDGESLDPAGFDFKPLLEKGFLNWNHQANTNAKAIVGEPTHAAVINDGKDFYIEGFLYDNEQGKAVAELAESLEKNSSSRRLGFSLEGKAQERDVFNPKKVKKAVIHHMAITYCPKNSNTLMSIMKGEYAEPFIEPKEESCPECAKKGMTEPMQEGKCVACGYEEKSMDVASISPMIRESVEGDLKDITNNFVSNKNSNNFAKELKKSEIYTSISDTYPIATIAEKKQIYSFVEAVNNKIYKMIENTISQDALTKAFSLLDEAQSLVKSEAVVEKETFNEGDVIKKSEVAEDDIVKSIDTVTFFVKSELAKEAASDILVKGGMNADLFDATWERVVADKVKAGDIQEEGAEDKEVKKSEDISELLKSELSKALEPLNSGLANTNEAITKSISGYGVILKSIQEQNDALIKSNSELTERLEAVEKTPGMRKSITGAAAIEKFAAAKEVVIDENTYDIHKSDDLKKLGGVILDYLDVNYISKGKEADELYKSLEGTVTSIEMSKIVPEYAYGKLRAMGIKLLDTTK